VGLCGWHVRCAAFHRLRRRFCSAATTTTARNAARNLHDHNDCYQLQFKRTAGKYARHVDRQVMAGWKKKVVTVCLSRGAMEMFQATQKRLIQRLLANPKLGQRVERLASIPGVGEITALTWRWRSAIRSVSPPPPT